MNISTPRRNILILMHNDATQFIDIANQYTALFDPLLYKVTVIYLYAKNAVACQERTIAEEVILLQNNPNLRGLKIQLIYQLLKLCKIRQFSIVICHRYKPIYMMLWIAQFCIIERLVFVLHELNTMISYKRKWLIKLLYKKNMYFAGVSHAVRDNLSQHLTSIPKQAIISLYNMIDLPQTETHLLTKTEARHFFRLQEQDFVFGNIARLEKNKDQHNLITAFAEIKKQYHHTKLIIIGDGKLAATLKEQALSLGLQKDILFTGYLNHAFRYLKAFDCFVLNSLQEAFGRVLLEAMVAKLPIIASRVNGIPEVLEKTGLLITPQHTQELIKAMQHIYELNVLERNALGEFAYKRVNDVFSIPQFKKQFWDQFKSAPTI